MSLLKVGDKIPDFSCYDDKENLITNNDLKGKKNYNIFLSKSKHSRLYSTSL
jgi:peroxiredoxin